ncbi:MULTISPECIES: MFS transporter [Microbacterium]|uniref:MFS transporter n=1 Tax=Microbacterium wangchenii TaxID=2541726 RepID=A0ABX5SV13_9MICO|nr:MULTISPECIES: MFS transporter [Microbacterium]MCK6068479.1 MFS transporter [Microbacterium sp. EYE_512]QBR90030.1 MFS transporter [Microbacterium wangchenii]TFV85118.1 MFS transporter [Microbacterium sp. dk485]TXK09250.1 MFS transporter [Microbacterium wangchenii]
MTVTDLVDRWRARATIPSLSISGKGAGLLAMAITQIVAWGVLYYAVLVAAPAIAGDTDWTDREVFLAITAGLLSSAVCAIAVGRWLDRHPRRVMVSGAVLGTLAMLGAAASQNIWTFATAWIVCGAAQAAVLYQAAFTVITHRYRSDRRGPLTLVTLAGGLASTIFAPFTGWLVVEVGWRVAFAILAVILAGVLVPVYFLTVERAWPHLEASAATNGASRRALQSTRFWVLTVALALLSFSLGAATLSAVPASVEKGLDLQSASWVLGLIGAGQILGRVLYLAVPYRSAPWIAPVVVGALGAASLAGYAVAREPGWIFAAAILAGAVRGAFTLVQASAVSDRWGTTSYGRLNGMLAAPISALTALAPGAAAVLAGLWGSYQAVSLSMAAICLAGGLLVVRR